MNTNLLTLQWSLGKLEVIAFEISIKAGSLGLDPHIFTKKDSVLIKNNVDL